MEPSKVNIMGKAVGDGEDVKKMDSSCKANQKEDTDNNDGNIKEPSRFSEVVAAHYNSIHSNDDGRKFSKIYYLRNFNNLIKSLLIKELQNYIPDKYPRSLKVLDICCGKGGDIIKWIKINANYLICADIAEKSLEDCRERLNHFINKFRCTNFQYEIIAADCTRVRLCSLYQDPSILLDAVSSQFSFHYSFESLPQVECMLMNISERLKPGGIFIGTIPNANEIVKRLKLSGSNKFGNELYSLQMCSSEPYPLFGAKYNFYLEGVVNCPEFLVYFPVLEKLASKFRLKLLKRQQFNEFFEEKKNASETWRLMRCIKALECYPPSQNNPLYGPERDYVYARLYWEHHESRLRQRGYRIGTISQSEWDIITLYEIFIFQKEKA